MKQLLIAIIAVAITLPAFSQDKSQHLVFKGIPIDGDFNVFAQKLVQKGFKKTEVTQDGIVLKGNFMATPDVMVIVYPDPKTKNVSSVIAMVEAGENWPSIENSYNNVVDLYTEKYGEPTEHIEEFSTDVHDDDYFRKQALNDGQCNYKSLWKVEGGNIAISLAYFKYKYYVVCTYIDMQNVKALRQTMIDDI